MKKIILAFCFLVCLGCQKNKSPYLNVSTTPLEYPSNGGTNRIDLSTNRPWTVSSSEAWCFVTPSGGQATDLGQFTINCRENTSYNWRSCTITVKAENETSQISVKQEPMLGFSIPKKDFELSFAEQDVIIEILHNIDYSITIPSDATNWIRLVSSKSTTQSQIRLHISENTLFDNRTAKLTISSSDGRLASEITIKQAQRDAIEIRSLSYEVSEREQDLSIDVQSNVSFSVNVDSNSSDWITYLPTKGITSHVITLHIFPNDTDYERVGKCVITQDNGTISKEILITQVARKSILVDQESFSLTRKAQTISVNVQANVEYDVIIPSECASWISNTTTRALPSSSFIFAVSENTSYEGREGTITFKQINGDLSATIVIRQDQTDLLRLLDPSKQLSYVEQAVTVKVETNVSYEVFTDDACSEWISVLNLTSDKATEVTLEVEENHTDDIRVGKVYFRKKDGTLETVLTLTQDWRGYISFSDPRFEKYCLDHFDINEDRQLTKEEASVVSEIKCQSAGIACVDELKYFTNLVTLDLSHNPLTELDLSRNILLQHCNLSNVDISEVDISHNSALQSINLYDCSSLNSLYVKSFSTIPVILVNGALSITNPGAGKKYLGYYGYPMLLISNDSSIIAIALADIVGKGYESAISGLTTPSREEAIIITSHYEKYHLLLEEASLLDLEEVDFITSTKTGKYQYHKHNAGGGTYITYEIYGYYFFNFKGIISSDFKVCDGPAYNCPRDLDVHKTGIIII